jgi:prepilin-type N-terminal cleavage/methylation domain-containing protein
MKTIRTNGLESQAGVTLLEVVVAVAIMGLILAPLATILNQFVFLPSRWDTSLALSNDSRAVGQAIATDARQAQTFIAGANPNYGTFSWTDRTGSATSSVSVLYFWDSANLELVRRETVDGATTDRTVAGGILDYSHVILQSSGGVVQASVTSTRSSFTEDSVKNTQIRGFLRTGSASSQPNPPVFRRAWDDFETSGFTGGNGWLNDWIANANATIVSTNFPQQGTYHLRAVGAALVANRGFAYRTIDLQNQTAIRLQFYAKANGFEAADTATAEVSVDGVVWQVLRTWTFADSNNVYAFFDFDLTPYALDAEFFIAFRSNGDAGNDEFYVDNLLIVRVWQ